jgi:RHS repeat-associated protein
LVSENDAAYEYDLNGNLIRIISTDKATFYTYDANNRLIRATVQSGNDVAVEEYEYDFEANRTVKKSELGYVRYLLDTNSGLTQVLAELDYDGNEIAYYTRGFELISQERNGDISYYLYDGHNSVRSLTDKDGRITDTYNYDAFGILISSTGNTENNYLYCGEQFDYATGLYYLRARYMNPSTGTFISMDVYQGTAFEPVSLHKYLYANANPVMYSDPSGYVATLGEAAVATAIIGGLTGGLLQSCLSVLRALDAGADISGMDFAVEFIDGFFKGVIGGLAIFLVMQILPVCIVLLGLGIMAFASGAQTAVAAYDEMQQGNYLTAMGYSVISIASFYIGGMTIEFALASGSCFTGDTLVSTENGLKRIDEIEIGDKVWSYNIETGELELKEVQNVFVKENNEILHLTTSNGETIDTTTNHPFYVEEKGWIAAGDLEIGDVVYTIDGEEAEITEMVIEKFAEPVIVYNLEVEDFHTYFVGNAEVLVHNNCYNLTSEQRRNIERLRRGEDVYVSTVEEARNLLRGMPDIDAPALGQRHPTYSDPPGTYRGDLLNTSDPTAGYVHNPSSVPKNPAHAKYPHFNIYFHDKTKGTILIDGG